MIVGERTDSTPRQFSRSVNDRIVHHPSDGSDRNTLSIHREAARSLVPTSLSAPHLSSEPHSPLIIGGIDRGTGFNNGINEEVDDTSPQPVALPGKEGIVYPGSTTVYPNPIASSSVGNHNPSPEYSRYDPNARVTDTLENESPCSQQDRPETQTASSESASSSQQSLEKPPRIALDNLDTDGFTAEERSQHIHSIRYLKNLRKIAYARLFLRISAVIVTLVTLIISAVIIDHFHKATRTHRLPDGVSVRPTSVLATFGGLMTLVSLVLLLLCTFIPRLRKANMLSNSIFAIISLIGLGSWLCGCIYLYHGRGTGRNLWYYTCKAAKAYSVEAIEGSHSENPDPEEAYNARLLRMCNMTSGAWSLAVVASVVEILTLLNVLIAIAIVRIGSRGTFSKGRPK